MTTARNLADSAIKLDRDVNGNPRYYLPVSSFCDESGDMYRPKFCSKYRGKKYGAGWVFQSYLLEYDIAESIKHKES